MVIAVSKAILSVPPAVAGGSQALHTHPLPQVVLTRMLSINCNRLENLQTAILLREIANSTAAKEFFPPEIAILCLSTAIESPFIAIPKAGIQLIADKIAIDVKLKAS